MKQIEEKAQKESEFYQSNFYQDFGQKIAFKDGFISGAEFVKKEYEEKLRWIPVGERLPERSKDEPNFSNIILCKFKFDLNDTETLYTVCEYYFNDNKFKRGSGQNTNVTHWREIL